MFERKSERKRKEKEMSFVKKQISVLNKISTLINPITRENVIIGKVLC